MTALESTKADIADRKLRAESADEIELVARSMIDVAAEFDAVAACLSEFTTRAVPWLMNVRGAKIGESASYLPTALRQNIIMPVTHRCRIVHTIRWIDCNSVGSFDSADRSR